MKISLQKIKNRWCPTIFLIGDKMNTHIVRVNEKIERIANIYNLTEDEIKKINTHILDWSHLVPGTKLRLPEIPEIVQTELDNTEPFIEEYYPKISSEELNKINESPYNVKEELVESPILHKQQNVTSSINKQKSHYYNPYYPSYGYYNSEYYNKYIRGKNKKKES